MNQWEIEFTKAMKGLTVMYGKECPPELMDLYETVLRCLTVPQLVLAVRLWIEDPKHVFFPLPAQLKAMVMIPPDKEAEAALIVEQIYTAQATYGIDPVGTERARKKIGDTGWSLIEAKGGWQMFWHQVQKEGADGVLKSQLRKSLMGLMDRKHQTEVNHQTAALTQGKPLSLENLGIKLPSMPKD